MIGRIKPESLREHYRRLPPAGKVAMAVTLMIIAIVAIVVAVPAVMLVMLGVYHLARLAWIAVLLLWPW